MYYHTFIAIQKSKNYHLNIQIFNRVQTELIHNKKPLVDYLQNAKITHFIPNSFEIRQ